MEKKTLFELSSEMVAIEDELFDNGGELTPELEQALAETEEGLKKKTDGYNSVIRALTYKSENIASEIKRLQALKKSADNSVKRLKEHILFNMRNFGIEKLEGQLCKMSIRKSKSLDVNEDEMLLNYEKEIAEFKKTLPPYINVEFKIDKTMIKSQYKETNVLPGGAEMVENESLNIR